jgi:hypothetical protein
MSFFALGTPVQHFEVIAQAKPVWKVKFIDGPNAGLTDFVHTATIQYVGPKRRHSSMTGCSYGGAVDRRMLIMSTRGSRCPRSPAEYLEPGRKLTL